MLVSRYLPRFAGAIKALPEREVYNKTDLLIPEFRMHAANSAESGPVEIYYAPHNEYVNSQAKIMIIGITPGWTQMELAYRTARKLLLAGRAAEEICRETKLVSRFAGSMRGNLCSMLDRLQLHEYLHIPSTTSLFAEESEVLHTTSMLRFPVFFTRQNYTGHRPALSKRSVLWDMSIRSVTEELALLNNPLLIPLGAAVQLIMEELADSGVIERRQCLFGFPHPSGANGSRTRQFSAHFAN